MTIDGSSNSPSKLRAARIEVLEEHRSVPSKKGSVICRIGDDIRINYEELRNLSLRQLDAIDLDLLMVCASIGFADRNIRRATLSWSRKLHLTVPVHERDRWSEQSVRDALEDTLNYLTGDIWKFSFVQRERPDPNIGQLFFSNLIPGEHILFPYSGGLDSFAAKKLLEVRGDVKPFYITIATSSLAKSVAKRTNSAPGCLHATIPIVYKKNDHPEPSSRTRTFLFFALTSLAARMNRSQKILVAENGQGSLGPSLVPSGAEHPYVGTHPGFTMRFSQFMRTLWKMDIVQFDHPYVWFTKSELLSELKTLGLASKWEETISCPRDMKRHKGPMAPPHCGVCSNCFLRRFSAFNAGLSPIHGEHEYLWNNLCVGELSAALDGRSANRGTTDNDKKIALGGVLSHSHLAQFAYEIDTDGNSSFSQSVYELSRALSVDRQFASERVRRLLLAHSKEWNAFLEALPTGSWVKNYAGGA
jgi:7-cyano-7-deazaguanine synthase in queuosine biosynthesis